MTVYITRISDAANGNPRYLIALADIAPKGGFYEQYKRKQYKKGINNGHKVRDSIS